MTDKVLAVSVLQSNKQLFVIVKSVPESIKVKFPSHAKSVWGMWSYTYFLEFTEIVRC